MFVRSKVVKGATYFQVIEGFRDEQGRVRIEQLAAWASTRRPKMPSRRTKNVWRGWGDG
jgi:hypothetical protein